MGAVTHDMQDSVLVLRFDPGRDGVMGARAMADLLDAVEAALDDDRVRVMVLTGARPGMFVRQYNVASILRSAEMIRAGTLVPDQIDQSPVARLYEVCAQSAKPIIAAINGTCMGGGLELVLCCTVRIAGAQVTQIGLPESRIGIFPGAGATQRLPRLIGEARALRFILDGTVVAADAAHGMGLVDAIADDPLAAAIALARRWAVHSPLLLAAILSLVRDASHLPLPEGIARERRLFGETLRNDDAALRRMQRFVASGADLGDYDDHAAEAAFATTGVER